MLLTRDAPAQKAKPAPKAISRDDRLALKSEVKKCEARVEKLNDMRNKLAKKLADPGLYEPGMANQAATWQKKYAEVMGALEKAEAMWMAALEKAEAAG